MVPPGTVLNSKGRPEEIVYSPAKYLLPDGTVPQVDPTMGTGTSPFGQGGRPIEFDSNNDPIYQSMPRIKSYPAVPDNKFFWDGSPTTVLPFVKSVEMWMATVDSEGITDPKNLEFYVKHGLEAFVRMFANSLHNPNCNLHQLRESRNHVLHVLTDTFRKCKATEVLVVQAQQHHDGWRLWYDFKKANLHEAAKHTHISCFQQNTTPNYRV